MKLKFVPILVIERQQFEQDNLYEFGNLQEDTVYKVTFDDILQFPLLQDIPVFLEETCVGLAKVVSIHQFPLKNTTVAEYVLSQELVAEQRELMSRIYSDLKNTFAPKKEKQLPKAKKHPK